MVQIHAPLPAEILPPAHGENTCYLLSLPAGKPKPIMNCFNHQSYAGQETYTDD